MKTFTVHTPPPSGSAEKDALDTLFVREGFALWAFLIPVFWLLAHRMWLVLLGYVVFTGLVEGAAYLIGDVVPGIFALVVTILFGLEANSLRRWTLDRKGYRFAAVASGRTVEEAEQRYFDSLSNGPITTAVATERLTIPAHPVGGRPRMAAPFAERPVTGLFPQPERAR